MTATVFRAHDAAQRQHLLRAIGKAFDAPPVVVEEVVEHAFEGADTSLYLWTFYEVGLHRGYDTGRRRGHESVFTPGPAHAVARAKAREARRARSRARKGKR